MEKYWCRERNSLARVWNRGIISKVIKTSRQPKASIEKKSAGL